MVSSANPLPAVRGRAIELSGARRLPCGRIVGIALIGAIYGITCYASRGLFQKPLTDPHHTAYLLLSALNLAVLPTLIVGAVAGVRRLWHDDAPNPRLCRLLRAPLWLSFILALLTVPVWMSVGNTARETLEAGAMDFSVTFLLAPWGLLVAYGLSLLIACAMFDFTFLVVPEAPTQPDTADLG